MSVLSTRHIRARLSHKSDDKRLVITPILDPETQLKDGDVSVDVRLGRIFSLPRPWSHSSMEDLSTALNAGPLVDQIVLDYGQPLILHPHQFVLARTLEVVRLPPDLMAYVVGRSSWGRRGLTVATATAVHPGFYGPITLELKNVGEVPISLYTFDRVAQLVFHTIDDQPSGPWSADDAADEVVDAGESANGGHSKAVAEGATGEAMSADEGQSKASAEVGNVAGRPGAPGTSAGGALGQFSSTFVPDLGNARDEKTRKKIESLIERRRKSSFSE
jgi:dCTP deaminase